MNLPLKPNPSSRESSETSLDGEIQFLREENRRLKGRLVQSQHLSKMGIWDWNMETDDVYWYGEMFNIYGITEEEFTGKGSDYFEFTHPSDQQIQLDNISKAVVKTIQESEMTGRHSRIAPDPNHFRIIRKDGSLCWVKGDAVTIIDERGKPLSMLGILIDVTEQKELENQLLQAQKMEPLGLMTGGLTHEFNNYLFAIQSYAEISLMEVDGSPELSGNLKQILTATKMATDLVKRILHFSRNTESDYSIVEPSPVIKEMVEIIKTTVPGNIQIASNISSSPKKIRGNLNQIHQIGANLINNAVQAVEQIEDGRVEIEFNPVTCEICTSPTCSSFASRDDITECMVLSVRDNGMGMEDYTKNKIFEPFYTTKSNGTGLGLSVVKSIVDQHEAIIEVQSEKGKGSQFIVYFPILDIRNADEKKVVIRKSLGLNSYNIHVVDDWPLLVDAYAKYFRNQGYRITSSLSITDAFPKLLDDIENVDLLITDYEMPDGSGIQLINEIRKKGHDFPIFLLSGYKDISQIEDISSLTRDENIYVLQKPIELGELEYKIISVLSSLEY